MLTQNDSTPLKEALAFNFLKNSLGIPLTALINRQFFSLFFEHDGRNGFMPKKPLPQLEAIIKQKNIPDLNSKYWELKEAGKITEAQNVAKEILFLTREGLKN